MLITKLLKDMEGTLWLPETSGTLRDLHIFVDHSADPVTSNDLDVRGVRLGESSEWGGLGEGSVWSVAMEVVFILSEKAA